MLAAFPEHMWDNDRRQETVARWRARGATLRIFDAPTGSEDLLNTDKPCWHCKGARRAAIAEHIESVMASLARQGKRLTVATGHAIWDLAAYPQELQLTHAANLDWTNTTPVLRGMESLVKLMPRFDHLSLPITFIRPSAEVNEQDVLKAVREGVFPFPTPMMKQKCRLEVTGTPKRFLQASYTANDLQFGFERVRSSMDAMIKAGVLRGFNETLLSISDWPLFLF